MPIRFIGKEDDLQKVIEEGEINFRKALLAYYQAVTSATPIDTGNARANWFMDFNGYSPKTTGSRENPGRVLPDGGKVNNFVHEVRSVIFHNSVEYVVYLEEGTSAQAPQGILNPAFNAVRRLFE